MPRLMSVSLTEQAVVERRKTVTRRTGWKFLKPGDRLTLCRKVMGRGKCRECKGSGRCHYPLATPAGWWGCIACGGTGTEPLVRLAEVEVVDVAVQQLRVRNTPDEAAREGFPDLTWSEFVNFFCEHLGGTPDQVVTRIEWRYLDQDEGQS